MIKYTKLLKIRLSFFLYNILVIQHYKCYFSLMCYIWGVSLPKRCPHYVSIKKKNIFLCDHVFI